MEVMLKKTNSRIAEQSHTFPVGFVFNTPLATGGYGLVVVATKADAPMSKSIRVTKIFCFGYGPKFDTPIQGKTFTLRPLDANIVSFLVDDHILDGRWTLAGSVKDFNQPDWLLPKASRWDGLCHRWLSYSINYDLMKEDHGTIEIVSAKQAAMMPQTGIGGGGVLEDALDTAIKENWRIRRPVTDPIYRPVGRSVLDE